MIEYFGHISFLPTSYLAEFLILLDIVALYDNLSSNVFKNCQSFGVFCSYESNDNNMVG